MFEFSKTQKLCSEALINRMFEIGNSITEPPFRFVWLIESNNDNVYVKTLISVSKKRLKLAKDRNLIKRRVREIFRINSIDLKDHLKSKKIQLNLGIIYNQDKICDSSFMEKKINLLLTRLITQL
tara:strand:- start:6956 stop:7330 length:375 start_codon:yes stop_codon:yes gene_type:complete